jgi:hypothetical protein
MALRQAMLRMAVEHGKVHEGRRQLLPELVPQVSNTLHRREIGY